MSRPRTVTQGVRRLLATGETREFSKHRENEDNTVDLLMSVGDDRMMITTKKATPLFAGKYTVGVLPGRRARG